MTLEKHNSSQNPNRFESTEPIDMKNFKDLGRSSMHGLSGLDEVDRAIVQQGLDRPPTGIKEAPQRPLEMTPEDNMDLQVLKRDGVTPADLFPDN